MMIEENGFHFRRVGVDRLRLAMAGAEPRWDGREEVRDDAGRGLARAPVHAVSRGRRERRSSGHGRASTT